MDETQVSQALSQLIAGAPEFWAQVVAEYQTQQTIFCIANILLAIVFATGATVGFTKARRVDNEENRLIGTLLSTILGGFLVIVACGFAIEAFTHIMTPNASLLMGMR